MKYYIYVPVFAKYVDVIKWCQENKIKSEDYSVSKCNNTENSDADVWKIGKVYPHPIDCLYNFNKLITKDKYSIVLKYEKYFKLLLYKETELSFKVNLIFFSTNVAFVELCLDIENDIKLSNEIFNRLMHEKCLIRIKENEEYKNLTIGGFIYCFNNTIINSAGNSDNFELKPLNKYTGKVLSKLCDSCDSEIKKSECIQNDKGVEYIKTCCFSARYIALNYDYDKEIKDVASISTRPLNNCYIKMDKYDKVLKSEEYMYYAYSNECFTSITKLLPPQSQNKCPNDYLLNEYPARFENTYKWIYILMQHQRISLIKLMDYSDDVFKNSSKDKLYKLREEFASLKSDYALSTISNFRSSQYLWNDLKVVLEIKNLLDDTNDKIDKIDVYLSEKRDVRENLKNTILFVIALLTFFSTFFMDMYKVFKYSYIIPIIVFAIFIGVYFMKKYKK